MKDTGIIIKPAPFGVKETMDKLQDFIEKNGATIYARIDQQLELKKAGIVIKALEFLLFGKPEAGGKLIVQNPVVALDLPLKIIAWEDEKKQVWLAFNDGGFVQERYALTPDNNSPLFLEMLITKALSGGTG